MTPLDGLSPREFFAQLPEHADPAKIAGVSHSYLFVIESEGRWLVDVRDGAITVAEDPETAADVTFSMSAETFERIQAGKQNPMMAYMTGKLKVTGDISAAMALQQIL